RGGARRNVFPGLADGSGRSFAFAQRGILAHLISKSTHPLPKNGSLMTKEFEALLLSKTEAGQNAAWSRLTEADLMEGDVTVRVTHSTINYKDGLAITGKAPVVRRWPMIPGIDFAGIVESSTHPEFKPGDEVVLNGWGTGETHFGGYTQYARVKGDWLVPLAAGLTRAEAM